MEQARKIIGSISGSVEENLREKLDGVLREMAQATFLKVLFEEVESLCGPSYHPREGAHFRRAGSTPGYFFDRDRQYDITRPRVREKGPDGRETEITLESYRVGQDPAGLMREMLNAFRAGVSSRDQASLHASVRGTSQSSVSRLWVREGAKMLEVFRSRDLGVEDWLILMLDGIALSDDLLAVVGLGITASGEKRILDFEIGSSENEAVTQALLGRITERGFRPSAEGLLVVLDGGKALKKAVRNRFGEKSVIQRCLVHKERNIRAYLSRRHHGELARLFNILRKAQGAAAAREALAALRAFLSNKNKQALESLDEAGDELIALHLLEVPSTLNISLLSTNCIENPFKNTRRKIGRVTRWRADTDQPSRWLAYAFDTVEKGFRKIKGFKDLPALAAALRRHAQGAEETVAKAVLDAGGRKV